MTRNCSETSKLDLYLGKIYISVSDYNKIWKNASNKHIS